MRLHLGDVDDANGSELELETVGGDVVLSVRCPDGTSGMVLTPHECRTLAHSLLQVAEQTKETLDLNVSFQEKMSKAELVEGLASAIEDVAYARGLDAEKAQKNLRARLLRWVSL